MYNNHPVVDFIKKRAFFLLGGAILVIVGIIYVIGRSSPAEVIRDWDRIAGVDIGDYDDGNSNASGASGNGFVDGSETAGVGSAASHTIGSDVAQVPLPNPTSEPETSYVIIHIVGAVNSPGVFELQEGARVNDALIMAGGANEDADLARINLAAFLHDAMQIIVPAFGEDIDEVFIFSGSTEVASIGGVQGGGAQTSATQNGGLININTATAAELQTLSGIGPALSQNIISFRETHGHFASVDELIHVSGIGQARLENLRNHVTV